MYIISDNRGCYIKRDGNNNRCATTHQETAEIFNTFQKADNVRISLSKEIKTGHNWQVFSLNSLEGMNTEFIEVDLDELESIIKDAANILSNMRGNKAYLINMLSNVDKEISDILHYIENYTFSACEGYKLAKALKVAREKRRKIKDQIEIIRYIDESTGVSIANGFLNKNIRDMNEREYTPRVLKELFENKNI